MKEIHDFKHLLCLYNSFSNSKIPVLNGIVMLFIHNNKYNMLSARIELTNSYYESAANRKTLDKIRLAMTRLNQKMVDFKKNLTRYWDNIVILLNTPFSIQPIETMIVEPFETSIDSPEIISDASIAETVCIPTEKVKQQDSKSVAYTTRFKRCSHCDIRKQQIIQYKTMIKTLKKKIQMLQGIKVNSLQRKIRKKSIANHHWRLKYTCQKNRNSELQKQLKTNLDDILRKQIVILKSRNTKQEKRNIHIQQELKSKINSANTQVQILSSEIRKNNLMIEQLVEENHHLISIIIDEEESGHIETISGRQYGLQLRKSIYHAIVHNVPVRNVGNVLTYLSNTMLTKDLQKVPHFTNIARMAYELGILATIQAGEMLLHSDVVTLGFDATTKVGRHLNTVCVRASPSLTDFSISTAQVAGGTATDYASHIISAFKEIASIYGDYKQIPSYEVMNTFKEKCKSTLTDRAPVNNCVMDILENQWDIHLIRLNCNVHPLDTIASESLKCLVNLEKESNLKSAFGKEGAAVTFVYNLSKLRYSYKGDSSAFKFFLKKHSVSPNTFVRYVGNRLHILFHLAGVVIRYKTLLAEFLKNNTKNEICSHLLTDINNINLMVHLQALGLIGKYVSGPWMTIVYKNAMKKTNIEMGPMFKTAIENIVKFKRNPLQLIHSAVDVFGMKVDGDDEVLKSLQNVKDKTQLSKVLAALLLSTEEVINRQLQHYLIGQLSKPTTEILRATVSAPTHNMQAERSFSLMDFFIRQAPNVTIGFLDSKIKAKINKTIEWIESQPVEEQEKLVNFAVWKGAHLRKTCKQLQQSTDEEIYKRRIEAQKKRDKTETKRTEKMVRKALQSEGGLTVDHEMFSKVEFNQKVFLAKVLSEEDVVGHIINHNWELENGKIELYFGRILKRKPASKTKSSYFVITYWGGDEDNAEDCTLSIESFVADMISGDLVFQLQI